MEEIYLEHVEDDIVKGHVLLEKEDDFFTIVSTVVKKEYQGQGIAKKLMNQCVKYATDNNLKIKATCSYAVSFFSKNPNPLYKD